MSRSGRAVEAALITTVALAGIAALTVGLLAHFSIIHGIQTPIQWTLVGAGAGLVVTSLVASVVCHCYLKKALHDLSELTQNELTEKIEAILNGDGDSMKEIRNLAKAIPLETLENLVQEKCSGAPKTIQAAKRMVGQARNYIESREELSSSIQTKLRGVLDTLLTVLDSIFEAFGIADFFKPSENKFDADFKFQKIMMLISLFTLLTATLLPMLGVTTGASIIGGVLILVAVMSLIWPKIRPCPSRIPEGENWSKQTREGKLGKAKGRKNAVDKIALSLVNKQHPLLIGPSGIGKTQTVQAFTRAVERGDYPELKGKTVFYFNTANLVGSKEMFNGGNRSLSRISDTIGRHREDCILIFDEIHLAYQGGHESALGEQLKTLLDDKEGNFPHVIGLTTEEEYYRDIYKDNPAGDRRFSKIKISSTEKEETLSILTQTIVEKASGTLVEEGALEYLIDKTKELPQPITALKLLTRCIQKTTHFIETPKSLELEKKKEELEHAYHSGIALGSLALKKEAKTSRRILDLENDVKRLEEELQKEQRQVHDLMATRSILEQTREAKFKSVIEIAEKEKSTDEAKQKEFLLLKYFFEEAVEGHLRTTAESSGFQASITKELVDEVLKEAEEAARKREEALQSGKKVLEERK